MGKINLDKLKSFDPIRTERQDVKPGYSAPVKNAPIDIVPSRDRVQLSGKAAEVGKLVSDVRELSGVRSDKVAEVRSRVEAGSFDPASETIADAIIFDERR